MYVTRRTLMSWQEEYAGTNWLPPIGVALTLFAVVAILVVTLLGGFDRVSARANDGKPPTLCQEHAGRPGWDSVCKQR
jgi:hypothetical protein